MQAVIMLDVVQLSVILSNVMAPTDPSYPIPLNKLTKFASTDIYSFNSSQQFTFG
jgi:hypothetical protein